MHISSYPSIDLELTGIKLKMFIKKAGYDVKFIQNYLQLSCPQPIYRWFKGKSLPSVDHFICFKLFVGSAYGWAVGSERGVGVIWHIFVEEG